MNGEWPRRRSWRLVLAFGCPLALIGGCESSEPPVLDTLEEDASAGGPGHVSRSHPAFRDRNICRLGEGAGSCGDETPSHWWNPILRRCQESSVGACPTNGNQFPNVETCQEACASQGDVSCDLVTCPSGSCHYFRGVAMCFDACTPLFPAKDGGLAAGGCVPDKVCDCVASCPTCTDCTRRCVPRWWGGSPLGPSTQCEALACPTGTACKYARLSGVGDRGPRAFCLVECPAEGGACPAGQTCGDVAPCPDCPATEQRCIPEP